MAEATQSGPDGSLFTGPDPDHPTVEQRKELLESALGGLDWDATLTQRPPSPPGARFVPFTAVVSRGSKTYTLEIYVFPNLAWAHRALDEKRIQLSRPFELHADDFRLDNTSDHRCLLLGFYSLPSGDLVICAWDAGAYLNHANPTSCYVNVTAISDAMRSGFGQSVDDKGRLVCCFRPEFMYYYIENMHELHDRVTVEQVLAAPPPDEPPIDLPTQNPIPSEMPRNRVIYGAPGTGKSHELDEEALALFPADVLRKRVTFYPDYSHAQFVGSYKPTPLYRDTDGPVYGPDGSPRSPSQEPMIDYRFVPGPFLEILRSALLHPTHSFLLIIEELNRADAPAVFGEAFQLLDRTPAGAGRFSVSLSPEASDYLKSLGLDAHSVRLPSNMYIWATMNSADQGVLPLDAAFKRRWSFQYLPLDKYSDVVREREIHLKFLSGPITWNSFRATVNERLLGLNVPEDRLIGPFFMSESELASPGAFKNKLLLYLREDVTRHEPEGLFLGRSYGELVRAYDDGKRIFVDEVEFPNPLQSESADEPTEG